MVPFESLGAFSYLSSILTMALSGIICEIKRDTDGEKNFEDIYNRLDRIPASDRQTDRRTDKETDGQTSCHGIVRAMRTRHAVKTINPHYHHNPLND